MAIEIAFGGVAAFRQRKMPMDAVFGDTFGWEVWDRGNGWPQPLAGTSAMSRRWHNRNRACSG